MRSIGVGLALLFATSALGAQSIAQRVRAASDGPVQMTFAARSGVCGDGRSFIAAGRSMYMGTSMRTGDGYAWRLNCAPGPLRVVLSVHDGAVDDLHAYVGPERETTSHVTDLGVVSTRAAVAYLLELAAHASGRVGERAILPAVLADSSAPWQELLGLARDSSSATHAARSTALFWLGRAASARVNKADLFADDERDDDDDDKTDIAGSAVFALSQLKHHSGVEPLIQVARTNSNPRVRAKAIFWLSQSGDPRAVDLIAEILRDGR